MYRVIDKKTKTQYGVDCLSIEEAECLQSEHDGSEIINTETNEIVSNVKVGKCIVNADGEIVELNREFYGQGMIFKDEYAFYHEAKTPCYVPELSDTVYTREDFLRICNDQDDIAEVVFGAVDWQHPESYLDEQYAEGEMATCKACGKIFLSYEEKNCPHCGAKIYPGDA